MFDWQDYYILARELLSLADGVSQEEAMLRAALSRAYYAAYNLACDYLRDIGEYPTKQEIQASRMESHKFLIEIFMENSAHPEWDEIGKKLYTLKNFRHRADYDKLGTYMFTNTSGIKKRIDDAEEIINLINSLKI